MASAVSCQHLVIHTLCTKFYRRHTVAFKNAEYFLVNAVGSCRTAYTVILLGICVCITLGYRQQSYHIIPVYCGKAAAEKRYLRFRTAVFKIFKLPLKYAFKFLFSDRLAVSAYRFLIAEAAYMRTAVMRYKYRNVSLFHIP